MGNRNDFNISQAFDIPTITGMKSKMANERNGLSIGNTMQNECVFYWKQAELH
jgi:hypothetical protein